jgi:hypothetical protein
MTAKVFSPCDADILAKRQRRALPKTIENINKYFVRLERRHPFERVLTCVAKICSNVSIAN